MSKRRHRKTLARFADIEEGIKAGFSPSEMISYETVAMYSADWVRAREAGYISDAGVPISDNIRKNASGTLLGGFSAGFKESELADCCDFFASGDINRYLGDLGLPPMEWDEILRWLNGSVKERVETSVKHRARDRSKEPHGWISTRAGDVLCASPEVRPSTWATYAALCLVSGKIGSEEFETTTTEIATAAGMCSKSVINGFELLEKLKLAAIKARPFKPLKVRLLSVSKV